MLSGYHSLPCYSYIFFLFLVIVILLLSLLLLLVQHCDYCRLSFSGSRSSFFPRSLPSFSSPFFSLLSTPHSSPCSLFPILLFTLSYPFFFLLIQSHTHKKIVLLFSLPCLPPLFLPLSPYPAPPTLPPHPSHPSLCALKNLMECSTERSGWSARRPIYHARVMLSRSIASQMYSGPRK